MFPSCNATTMVTPPSIPNNFFLPLPKLNFNISTRDFHLRCARAGQLSSSNSIGQIINPKSAGLIHNDDDFWPHQIELQVRDYELDQFGVVNNATYANYCEHGRLTALKMLCFTSADIIAASGVALAVSDLSLNFIAPLRSGDRFLVKVRAVKLTATRLVLEQFIVKLPKQEPIVKATATVVWLDQKYRPIRIPPDVISNVINAHQRRIITHK